MPGPGAPLRTSQTPQTNDLPMLAWSHADFAVANNVGSVSAKDEVWEVVAQLSGALLLPGPTPLALLRPRRSLGHGVTCLDASQAGACWHVCFRDRSSTLVRMTYLLQVMRQAWLC